MPAEECTGAVAGLLLAAGTASRMGSDKLLIELEGESLLRRAARRASDAGLAPLIVVLGHAAERRGQELGELPCTVIRNESFADGIGSSLRAGAAVLPDEVDAAVVLLADMPLVTSAMIAAVVRRFRESGAALVASAYDGVTAPPILYARRLFGELRTITSECGKAVLRRHRSDAQLVSWPPAALLDLDRPEDLARLATAARPL